MPPRLAELPAAVAVVDVPAAPAVVALVAFSELLLALPFAVVLALPAVGARLLADEVGPPVAAFVVVAGVIALPAWPAPVGIQVGPRKMVRIAQMEI